MPIPIPARQKLNVRTKILIIFLALSLISLLITGYVAFYTIRDVGRSAETSSLSLGQEAVNETSSALRHSGEENLLQIATGEAAVTNVLFEDTDSEMEILAAGAKILGNNPPVQPEIRSFGRDEPPPDPGTAVLFLISPGSRITRDSEEFKALAGLDDLLYAVYRTDENMSSIYVATDSGIVRMYPWITMPDRIPDSRQRAWFVGAENTSGIFWTEPYVDAAGHGLVMTASKAVNTKYGTWVVGSDVTIRVVNTAFLNMTLGGKGYAVLMDGGGTIISRPGLSAGNASWDEPFNNENVFQSPDPALVAVGKNMTAGKTGVELVRFGNEDTYVAYAPVGFRNWSFAVSMPVAEITAPVEKTQEKIISSTRETGTLINRQTGEVLDIFAVLFLVLLVIVTVLAIYLARVITRPVELLKEGTLALGRGNLDYRVMVESGDEFEELAGSFNRMAADLKQNIENLRKTTAEKERYIKELEIAKEIQESILPESTPDIPGFETGAVTIPAMEIGGDLYDFIPVEGNRWGFTIADVSGKGVSAALFMAISRNLIRASGRALADPSAAIRQANRLMYQDNRSNMFITVFYGVLDPLRMTFAYVNAGHNPPLLVRGDPPEIISLEGKGIALGVVPDVNITPGILTLERGDLIVMYTDGVTEAFNKEDVDFGEERLMAFVRRNRARPAGEIISGLLEEIRQFAGNAPQSDDITLVVLRVL